MTRKPSSAGSKASRSKGKTAADTPASLRPSRKTQQSPQARRTREFVVAAAAELHASHCSDVTIFDVRDISDLTDYIIIATGTSDRQIRSVSRDVATLARQYNLEKFGTDSDEQASWIVTDLVEVIVHLFETAARAHYDLEMMWGDAPRIDWRKEAPLASGSFPGSLPGNSSAPKSIS